MGCSSGYPKACYVAEDKLDFLILLPYLSGAEVIGINKHHTQLKGYNLDFTKVSEKSSLCKLLGLALLPMSEPSTRVLYL